LILSIAEQTVSTHSESLKSAVESKEYAGGPKKKGPMDAKMSLGSVSADH
jgi:hypothetical protein